MAIHKPLLMWLTCTLANMSTFAETTCDTIREAVGLAHNNPLFRGWIDVAGLPVYIHWHRVDKNWFIQVGVIASSTHEFLEVLQNLRFYKSKYAILVDDIKGVLVNGTTGFDLRQAAGWTIELLVDKAVFVKAANYP